jgi:hypothetical protein
VDPIEGQARGDPGPDLPREKTMRDALGVDGRAGQCRRNMMEMCAAPESLAEIEEPNVSDLLPVVVAKHCVARLVDGNDFSLSEDPLIGKLEGGHQRRDNATISI